VEDYFKLALNLRKTSSKI